MRLTPRCFLVLFPGDFLGFFRCFVGDSLCFTTELIDSMVFFGEVAIVSLAFSKAVATNELAKATVLSSGWSYAVVSSPGGLAI